MALGKYSGPDGVHQAQSAPNLGVDFTMGNRVNKKSRKTLIKRSVKMKRRLHRLAQIRRAGANMHKIYQTGLKAAAYYGAAVVGLTSPEVHEAQSLYLEIVGPRCATRS
eukprot:1368856-Pyramimonas_sp.AAC.1